MNKDDYNRAATASHFRIPHKSASIMQYIYQNGAHAVIHHQNISHTNTAMSQF